MFLIIRVAISPYRALNLMDETVDLPWQEYPIMDINSIF